MARIIRSQLIALDGIIPGSNEIWRTAIPSSFNIPDNSEGIIFLPYGIGSDETFGKVLYFKFIIEWKKSSGGIDDGASDYHSILKQLSLKKEKVKVRKIKSIKEEECFGRISFSERIELKSCERSKEKFGITSYEIQRYRDTDDEIILLLLAA